MRVRTLPLRTLLACASAGLLHCGESSTGGASSAGASTGGSQMGAAGSGGSTGGQGTVGGSAGTRTEEDAGAAGTGSASDGGQAGERSTGGAGASGQPGSCDAPILEESPLAECLVGLCGNGTQDSCPRPCEDINCPFAPAEACDPASADMLPCATIGFMSGAPACTDTCAIDTRGCESCAPTTGPVLSCERACLDTGHQVTGLAVGASDARLAVAWVSRLGDDLSAHLALLDPDLQVVARPPSLPGQDLAVAPSTNGWLVAAVLDSELAVYAFDAGGERLGDALSLPGATRPAFGSRPGGSPLLTWTEAGALRGAIVTDDGSFADAPATLVPYPMGRASVTTTDSGFLLAVWQNVSVVTTTLSAEGGPSGVVSAPVGEFTQAPELVRVGDTIGLVYSAFREVPETLNWAPLDELGALAGQPVLVREYPLSGRSQAQLLAAAGDAILLTDSADPQVPGGSVYVLEALRLDAAGAVSGDPILIGRRPYSNVLFDVQSLGDLAVIAFADANGINLATLAR